MRGLTRVLEKYNIKVMYMTQKTFKLVRIIIAFLLAIIMAQAVIFSNYILAAIAIAAAAAVIFVARKKVEGVLADERDNEVSGKAARLSLNIFSAAGAVATFVFISLRNTNPDFEVVGSVLAYSVCALLLLYSLIFAFYEKQN